MVFLVNLSRVIYAPLLEPLRTAFNADPGTIGTVVTLVWVGSALPRIPTGYLLTRVPRHYVVLGSGGVLTFAAAFASQADSLTMLGVGALLMGLSSGAYFVSANPLVSELYPNRVGRAIGLHGGVSQLAAVVAAPLVTVALFFGTWRAIFAGISVSAALATVVLYFVARRAVIPAASGADRDLLGAVRAQWRLIAVGIFAIGLIGFVWQGVFNFYVSYLIATKGVSEAAARNLLTVVFLSGLPAFLISGRLVDRFPQVPYLLFVMGAFVLTVFALTVSHGVSLLVVTALLGFTLHSLYPATDSFLLRTFPDEHRGGAYAVFSGGMMLTQAPGSSAVGHLVNRGIPYDTIFGGFATVLSAVVLSLVVLWALGRFPGAERKRAPFAHSD